MNQNVILGSAALILTALLPSSRAGETDLPDAKPVPAMQCVPLPNEEATFQFQGKELARAHFAPWQQRPFWYPLVGPSGLPHTRMGHPHDPVTHSHHNSVWISHNDVGGVNFWADRGVNNLGRIIHQRTELFDDGPQEAAMITVNAWIAPDGNPILFDRRRAAVEPLEGGDWLMTIDLQLESPGRPVILGKTPFGMIGVRMAKTIGVHDGGGRILNSEGKINEGEVFRKPARWVDYSGPLTDQVRGGIALLDHPQNPDHPTPFHVREDGWMGACLTLNRELTIQPKEPLRLRYRLWVHAGVPNRGEVDKKWQAFSESVAPNLNPKRP